MQFDVINFKNYLDELIEKHPGCADYKIKFVIPNEGMFGVFGAKYLDIAHQDNLREGEQPYIALVLDNYSIIKELMESKPPVPLIEIKEGH